MPKLQMIDFNNPVNQPGLKGFQFSAIKPDELEEAEYTLATILVDNSGSVDVFKKQLLESLKVAVRACARSPRAENLLMRVLTFGTSVREVHGFKPLAGIDADKDYGPFRCNEATALYDASYDAIGAAITYGETLTAQHDLSVNAIVFIITDGVDNSSRTRPALIADRIQNARSQELLESLTTVLVGINDDHCRKELNRFKRNADLTMYVSAGNATPNNLAKLANFVSKSVSTTSMNLGRGGGAKIQPLTF